jgi:hypothetical protein
MKYFEPYDSLVSVIRTGRIDVSSVYKIEPKVGA